MPFLVLSDPQTHSSRPIALLGAGVLGRRIATVFVAAGHNVTIRDPSEQARADAIKYIDENKHSPAVNTLPRTTRPSKLGAYTAHADIDSAVKDAWLVIEAVPERLSIKIDTMGELDQKAPKDCIFGSNSSSFRSSLMLDKVSEDRKRRILNVHFTMPPTINTIELMTDGFTDGDVITRVKDMLQGCGMIPVVARRESTGFIFNRLWAAIKREILFILAEDVSTPEEIDTLWRNMFQLPQSQPPCRMMDQIGLDTVAFIEDNYVQERGLDPEMTVNWLRRNYLDAGKLGKKTPQKGGLYPAASDAPSAASAREPTLLYLDVGLGSNLKDLSQVATNGKIMRRDATGSVSALVKGLPLPDGLDVSDSTGRLFWTNMGNGVSTHDGSVQSCKLDGTDIQTVIPSGGVHTPKQLVLDDAAKKVYFCDREGMSVHRVSYDGSNHEVLIKRGNPKVEKEKADQTRWCVGITLDTKARQVYWTQKGFSKSGKGRIFRAPFDIPTSLSAEHREDIETIFEKLPEPIDLEFDETTQMLYWTDRGEHPIGCTLNRAYVGKEVQRSKEKKILARHFHEPIGLKIDPRNKRVFVADLGGSLYTVSLDDAELGKKEEVLRDAGSYTGIALTY
ncbi:NAD(P)-binding protein [Sporormia fimetaria CBS 119925]|uniref:NAD(P)-binding protein n=1 Tax=Sporormia fimetaria CBS 119925 TaxID=1340428 RepID=A0A6A6V2M8_9PLEO|nr:NAD(P)-binding protein [Sporormia fimetaria CBS 119925]